MNLHYALIAALLLPAAAAAVEPQIGLTLGYTSHVRRDRPWGHLFVGLDGSLGLLEPNRNSYGLPTPFGLVGELSSGRGWQAGVRGQARINFAGRPGVVLGGFGGLRLHPECGKAPSAGAELEVGAILEKGNLGPRVGLRTHTLVQQLRGEVTITSRPQFSVANGAVFDPVGSACPFGYLGRPVRDAAGQGILPCNDGTDPTWLETAREEHAAVASFVVLAHQLTALRAPRALIGRAWQAAAEEAGHAVAAYARAGTTHIRPLRLPSRPVRDRRTTVARIAHEALWDGVINEALAADDVLRQRDDAHEDALARHLDRVHTEERSHIELNADVWRWCRSA